HQRITQLLDPRSEGGGRADETETGGGEDTDPCGTGLHRAWQLTKPAGHRLQCTNTGVQNREQHIPDLDGEIDDVVPQNPELSSSGRVVLVGLVGEGGVLFPGCVAQLEALAEQITRRCCGAESVPDPDISQP